MHYKKILVFIFCTISFNALSKESLSTYYRSQTKGPSYLIKGNLYKKLNGIVASKMKYKEKKLLSKKLLSRSLENHKESLLFETKGRFIIYKDHPDVFLKKEKLTLNGFLKSTRPKKYLVLFDQKNGSKVIPIGIRLKISSEDVAKKVVEKYKLQIKHKYFHLKSVIFEKKDPLTLLDAFRSIKSNPLYKDAKLVVFDKTRKKR